MNHNHYNDDALSLIFVEFESSLTLTDVIVDKVSALAVVAFSILVALVDFIAKGATAVDFESNVTNTSKADDGIKTVSVGSAVKCRIETFISVYTVAVDVKPGAHLRRKKLLVLKHFSSGPQLSVLFSYSLTS